MPVLHLFNITYQFKNGEELFSNISCSLNNRRVALVGRNGIGKSILSQLLAQNIRPTKGAVSLNTSVSMYQQTPLSGHTRNLTIAKLLNVEHILDAIDRIESGCVEQCDFDTVEDNWELKLTLRQQLEKLNLPTDLNFPCHLLSGGQLAIIQLWRHFKEESGLLILDEPSNHLDAIGKKWLIDEITNYKGYIFLVSHDRNLLNEMNEIWELSDLGLKQFGGNYNFYFNQKAMEAEAAERQIKNANTQLKKIAAQSQKNREKAEKRAAKGKMKRNDGSQPKVLLDAKRDNAAASLSKQLKNEKMRYEHIQLRAKAAQEKQEQTKIQKLHVESNKQPNKRLVNIKNGALPYGNRALFNLTVYSYTKLHLTGHNGSGKSTLLKVLSKQNSLSAGELSINGACYYLDQHFDLLNANISLIENVKYNCSHVDETNARTLLAGIGFRKDRVNTKINDLSGGEKMKLAMLIVSHQAKQPLLLLDEPDNHLDIGAKALLAETLNSYQGAFILVSHDDEFSAQTGITCVMRL